MTYLHCVILTLAASFLMFGCGSPDALSEAEMAKLDPVLQQLFMNDSPPSDRYQTHRADDGTLLYEVILMADSAALLAGAGIRYDAYVAGMATARLSVADIKKAARTDGVTAIRNSELSYPNGSGEMNIEEQE